MRNTTVLAMSLSVALLGGCVSRSWNGKVRMWGTLRGVLHDGDTSGKVRLSDATGRHGLGIGAPEGLAGEIVVIGGESWVAQADPQGRMGTQHPAAPDTMATFLAVATVAYRSRPLPLRVRAGGHALERGQAVQDVGEINPPVLVARTLTGRPQIRQRMVRIPVRPACG